MKHLFYFVLVILTFSCTLTNVKQEQSISESVHLMQSTIWYQKSAEMQACYYQSFNLAKYCLENNLKTHKGTKKTAVVLDIDETVLDNSPFEANLIKTGQNYTLDLWRKWTDKKEAESLPGAVDFTNYAKKLGVEVIYISNRRVNELNATVENLKTEGFPNADSNFVFLRDTTGDKTERRERVSKDYDIILFVGDNLTDFDEKFANRDENLGFDNVKKHKSLFGNKYIILPNPMYGGWEKPFFKNQKNLTSEQKQEIRKSVLKGF